jgi:Family of unknown function (DUF6152)
LINLRVSQNGIPEAEAIAMRSKVIAALVLAVGVVSFSVPLMAHHGTAAFQNDKKVTATGTVAEWLWSNPHCLLSVDVKGDDGKVVRWVGETQNPVSMTNVGWSKAAIKAGDEVTITILPVKNGMPLGRLVSVVLPNGKTLISGEGEPKDVRDELERKARESRP